MVKGKSMGRVLKEQLALIKPEEDNFVFLKEHTREFVDVLTGEINKAGYDAEVFLGGSFAKGTLVKKKNYDVDVFVRFDWEYDAISDMLFNVLGKVCKRMKLDLKTLHGSRDYFIASKKGKGYFFEIIPVTRIRKVHEERNVTDLSYFHVSYVKRKIKGLEDEILLAKTFFHGQKVYGAESYIHGFHGYALECLIIKYRKFEKLLKELVKVKIGERLVIDLEKHYKNKNDVFFELNENRLHSPVILIDPVYKERNALASLSNETFLKFQKAAKAFLKNPGLRYFVEEDVNPEKLRKSAGRRKGEFLHLRLSTDRQEGDIAGTKLKKFSEMLEREIGKYFGVLRTEFEYDDKKSADFYLIVKSRKKIVRIGPPVRMKKHVAAFNREHRGTYEKNGYMHVDIKVNFTAKNFVRDFKKDYKHVLKDMSIIGLMVL
jgi:tRNA nucleotidyltransferase (CCA-adding enzyme)